MKEFVSKLSSYNLFNYLLPGVIFSILASKMTHYSFLHQDIVVGFFHYYFIGLVISRFGSLTIEPVLKCSFFLNFAGYKDYVSASKTDKKIEILSEVNNMYRTLCSLFVLLLLLKLYQEIETTFISLKNWSAIILVVMLLIMFLMSYRKQTNFIKRRVEASE